MNFSFQIFSKKLRNAVTRFPLTFVSIIALAVMIVVNSQTHSEVIYMRWISAGILSTLVTLAFYLFAENRFNKWITHAINLVLIGLAVWLCATFPKEIPDANGIQLALLVLSLALAILFAGYISEKKSLTWWEYLQNTLFQLAISAFFAGILMGGLSLALVSLDKLFGINIKSSIYQYLSVFCFVLFAPSYFMAQISQKNTSEQGLSIPYPNIFKILGLYILLPILSIYTIILYGYLFKIIAVWELPNGWVSWLVSILGFAGFLTMIILHPLYLKGENKIIQIFTKFFPVFLFPLLILMFVGIVRRFSDYGITINRLLVLILNIWFFGISIYLFISKSRQPKWILISFSAIAFLSAIGPWSVINITEKSMKNEFTQLLKEANWTNSKQIKSTLLAKEKQQRLADVAYYLQRTYGVETIRPMFSSLGENADADNLIKALGITDPKIIRDNYFSISIPESSYEFNIADYKKAIHLRKQFDSNVLYKSDSLTILIESQQLKILQNKKETTITLEQIIENGKYGKRQSINPEDLFVENSGFKLIVFDLDGQLKMDNSITINYLNGILLLK